MGHAIDALGDGLGNVVGNPTLVAISYAVSAAAAALSLVVGAVGIVLSFVPLVGPLIAQLLFAATTKPLLIAGVLGPAGRGFAGGVEFGDALEAEREHFVGLACGFSLYELLRMAVSMLFGLGLLVLVVFGSVGVAALDDPVAAPLGLGLLFVGGYLGFVTIALALVVAFQFVDAAIVFDGASVVDAFAESWRLVREAPLSVLGYSTLRVVLGGLVVLPGWVVAVGLGRVSDLFLWVGFAAVLLLSPLAFAAVMSFHAAYYGHRVRAA